MSTGKIGSNRGHAQPTIAVLIPCYNEATTIDKVVSDFRRVLPQAQIYVYDNNSTDGSAEKAARAGAVVRSERRQGKGHVVRRMFADVDADAYLLVDGDATYEADAAPRLLLELVSGPFDKVNGARVPENAAAYRQGHEFGNKLLSALVALAFGAQSRDMLSGYKVLSRRFVKSFPSTSTGFEIETELLVHALDLGVPMSEVDTVYVERPPGSHSKLSTLKDGVRIMWMILQLIRDLLPFQFFSSLGACLVALSVLAGVPIIIEYVETGLVPRLPTAVLSTGLMLLGFLSLFSGVILDSVAKGRKAMKMLVYLSYEPVSRNGAQPSY